MERRYEALIIFLNSEQLEIFNDKPSSEETAFSKNEIKDSSICISWKFKETWETRGEITE